MRKEPINIINYYIHRIKHKKMAERKHKAVAFTERERYLLTGKVICGECGSSYTGLSRKARLDRPQYISYRCSKNHGAIVCPNTEIQRNILERFVLAKLSEDIFNDEMLPKIIESYNSYVISIDEKMIKYKQNIVDRMAVIDSEINNIVKVISSTGPSALVEKLNSLESEKSIWGFRYPMRQNPTIIFKIYCV